MGMPRQELDSIEEFERMLDAKIATVDCPEDKAALMLQRGMARAWITWIAIHRKEDNGAETLLKALPMVFGSMMGELIFNLIEEGHEAEVVIHMLQDMANVAMTALKVRKNPAETLEGGRLDLTRAMN